MTSRDGSRSIKNTKAILRINLVQAREAPHVSSTTKTVSVASVEFLNKYVEFNFYVATKLDLRKIFQ